MNLLRYFHAWFVIIKNFFLDYRTYKTDRTDKTFVRGKKYIFIFLAADYNNLGDIAITYAQESYIKSVLGTEYDVVKVYEAETYAIAREVKKLKKSDVIITLIGGGNNGSLYEFLEHPRRFLLLAFRKYKIISFPQTVYFENKFSRLPYKQIFKFVCNRCNNLTLIARDQLSYERYLEISKANVILTPDIVFSLEFQGQVNTCRSGTAFILRDDIEKAMDAVIQNQLVKFVKELGEQVYFWDTCNVVFNGDNDRALIFDYLERLSHVRYAVTDRLHGMILCYISRTPCIVIDNNNNKISSVYKTWLLNQNFIKLLDNCADIRGFNCLIEETKDLDVKYESLMPYFKPIERNLKNE